VDVDVLESLTGTGYPDGETSFKQVKKAFRLADPSFCDIVEAAPALDNTGTTVEKTSDLLKFMASEIS
jgi:arginase family enzyme